MGDVVSIAPVQSTATGEAVCMHCQHEWVAVAPTGMTWLDCPECGTQKGGFKFPFGVPVGDRLLVCDCGNDIFFVTPVGCLCPNCGCLWED